MTPRQKSSKHVWAANARSSPSYPNHEFEDVRQRNQTNTYVRYKYQQFRNKDILATIVIYDDFTAAPILRQKFSSETVPGPQGSLTQESSETGDFIVVVIHVVYRGKVGGLFR